MSDEKIEISNEAIDEIKKEVSKDLDKNSKEIMDELKSSDKSQVANKGERQTVKLDGLGHFETITPEEAKITLGQMNGIIFKVNNCMFKVCYINEEKFKFSAEIVNLTI
jgi:hypothetical protein